MSEQTFGQRLKALRRAKGLSLDKLANAAGCGKTNLWELEKDKHNPSARLVLRLADALGTTMEYLMRGYDRDDVAGVHLEQLQQLARDVAYWKRAARAAQKIISDIEDGQQVALEAMEERASAKKREAAMNRMAQNAIKLGLEYPPADPLAVYPPQEEKR